VHNCLGIRKQGYECSTKSSSLWTAGVVPAEQGRCDVVVMQRLVDVGRMDCSSLTAHSADMSGSPTGRLFLVSGQRISLHMIMLIIHCYTACSIKELGIYHPHV
jgi:hypothetical protein